MQTVYELSWKDIAIAMLPGFCFVAVSTLLWFSGLRRERGFRYVRSFVSWMMCLAVGICWMFVVVRIGCRYKTQLRTGQCRVVEGTVAVLQRQTKTTPAERVLIGGEMVSFSDNEDIHDRLRYHWIIVNGGPLTNGAYARLHVWDGNILKVEIDEPNK